MSEKAGECGEYRHQRRGGDDLRDEGHADRLADALHMPGTEVEPDDRLDALLEAAVRTLTICISEVMMVIDVT